MALPGFLFMHPVADSIAQTGNTFTEKWVQFGSTNQDRVLYPSCGDRSVIHKG